MKKLLMILALLAVLVSSTAQESSERKEPKTGVIIGNQVTGGSTTIKRMPHNYDIILYVQNTSLLLLFNGDYGLGTYTITDLSSGYMITDEVDTTLNSYVFVPFILDDSFQLSFDIEFADGSWCHLEY